MDNEKDETAVEPMRGPKTERAVGRAVIRFALAAGVAFGALLGANNSLGGIITVLVGFAIYAAVVSYYGVRAAMVEDRADYIAVQNALTPGTCGDPNCVACNIRRALAKGFPASGVIVAGEKPTDKAAGSAGGFVH